jgi:hypothetical protein
VAEVLGLHGLVEMAGGYSGDPTAGQTAAVETAVMVPRLHVSNVLLVVF